MKANLSAKNIELQKQQKEADQKLKTIVEDEKTAAKFKEKTQFAIEKLEKSHRRAASPWPSRARSTIPSRHRRRSLIRS